MAKKAYIGVDGVAKKVKKIYVGVDGKARKVKKGYIGVGGVARPFWAGGELTYYGKVSGLSMHAYYQESTTVNGYGFARTNTGEGANGATAVSPTLTVTKLSNLDSPGYYQYPAENGKYAIFCGGRSIVIGSGEAEYFYPHATAYDTSYTKKSASSTGFNAVYRGARAGNSALFFGVWRDYGGSNVVIGYNQALTKTNTTRSNSSSITSGAASTVGNRAVFVTYEHSHVDEEDGWSYSKSVAMAYSSSLTRTNMTAPSTNTSRAASYEEIAGSVGNNAVFMDLECTPTGQVTAYTSGLTKMLLTSLGRKDYYGDKMVANAGEDGEFLIFAGGHVSPFTEQAPVRAYDESLTLTFPPLLSGLREDGTGITAGKYAVFTGGFDYYSDTYDYADVYTVV